jgi:acetyl coenzyme A synthetase (ADP forming)-like protein
MPNSAFSNLPVTDIILRDGRSLRLRPIRADDKRRLEDLFYRLSPHARYLRFHHVKNRISEEELRYFTEVSPPEHCAYVASLGEGADERIIGVARWLAQRDRQTAEVAFTVDDSIQFQGIGTALLEQLAAAGAQLGFKRFLAEVLPENSAMQRVFENSGFPTSYVDDGGELCYTMDITAVDEFNRRHDWREHVARSAGVTRLLYPRSVAVIGASRDAGKPGGALFRNLLLAGFTGTAYPVNRTASAVSGVKAYPSVLDVPDPVDLAVIAVPAAQVLDVVDECAKKGVWGLVIITAGFGETGGEGKVLEARLRDKVLSHGMRLIGPNCLGIINTDASVGLRALFAAVAPPPGRVSMGSQSGALGLALLEYAKELDLGVAQFVSIGNRVDVSSNDLLEFWEDDKSTDIILLYMESFGNPRKFSRIARRVSRVKPVIVVKGGRSVSGARAAQSHTGALASADVAADALFRQAGVIRSNTLEEMFGAAQVLLHQPLPKGDRVAIVTNGGGLGILAADACESEGMAVPALPDTTRQVLQSFLPPEAATSNPIDLMASASPNQFRLAVFSLLASEDVDAVMVLYVSPQGMRPREVADAIAQAIGEANGSKPVVACFMVARENQPVISLPNSKRVPVFPFPENAARALAAAHQYAEYRGAPEAKLVRYPDVDRTTATDLLAGAKAGDWLQQERALALLKAYGIRVVQTAIAMSAPEAASVAERLGFPVAVKLRSDVITHKTDVGGVVLNLRSKTEVEQAYQSVVGALRALGREQDMQGVVVQQMSPLGQEVIIGTTQDPEFGPLVMLGLGGVQVELTKDVAFSLHPLTDIDPQRMLAQLKTRPLLTGFRGSPARDTAALQDVLLRFSALLEDFPQITQLEVNPVVVLENGRGCIAVDARVQVGATPLLPFRPAA